MKLKTGLVYSSEFKKHITGVGHPERPERTEAVYAALKKAAFAEDLTDIKPAPATHEDLVRCHTAEYIERARHDVASGASLLSTGDTNICRDSYDIALLAAGGVIRAVDQVCRGELKNAFCAIRPPGHHATPTHGMGFCLFGNVALGAHYALARQHAERILIVDWDVHHGNGTQALVEHTPNIRFVSMHQWPWYPGTGAAEDRGPHQSIWNVPMTGGLRRERYVSALLGAIDEATKDFVPGLVMISAGFDSLAGDPLGEFTLEMEDVDRLTRELVSRADQWCGGRLVSALEGGYAPDRLGQACVTHMRALL